MDALLQDRLLALFPAVTEQTLAGVIVGRASAQQPLESGDARSLYPTSPSKSSKAAGGSKIAKDELPVNVVATTSQASATDPQSRFYWQLQDALRSAYVVERACAELYLPESAAGVSGARLATCAPAASAGTRGGRMGMGQPCRAGGHMHVPERYWLLLTCAVDALHPLLDCCTFGDLLRLRAPDECSRSTFERLCTLLSSVTFIDKSKLK